MIDLDWITVNSWLIIGIIVSALIALTSSAAIRTTRAINVSRSHRRAKERPGSEVSHPIFGIEPDALAWAATPSPEESESLNGCSLDVRQAQIPVSCCLLHSKQGRPLHGRAIDNRIAKLRRLDVLI